MRKRAKAHIGLLIVLGTATLLLSGCSSAYQSTVYQPEGSSSPPWVVKVELHPGFINSFHVVINDSVVIDRGAPNAFKPLDAFADYEGHRVELFVVYSPGLFGIGARLDASVNIDGKLAGRFVF